MRETGVSRLPSSRRMPHVAVLVLLAAAARAGVVAADLLPAVADRLGHLGLAAGVALRRLRLLLGRLLHGRRRGVRGGADHPHRLLERLALLYAEDHLGRLLLDALPHVHEFL